MHRTITVEDMACDACAETIEGAVADVDGVTAVEADHEAGTVAVEGDAEIGVIEAAIADAGYDVASG